MNKKIILTSTILLASLALAGCGNNQSTNSSTKAENSSLKAENNSLKQSETGNIVGSYKDDQDGAAITLNSDGTGRYVYADPVDSDTDDQLTWKKNSDGNYTIKLQDSNVTSPLTGKLDGNKLTLSGDENWNTESFTKTNGSLNLDKFLSDNHGNSTSHDSNDSEPKVTTPQQAAQLIAGREQVDPGIVYAMPSGDGFIVRMDDHPYMFVTRDGKVSTTGAPSQNGPYVDGNGQVWDNN